MKADDVVCLAKPPGKQTNSATPPTKAVQRTSGQPLTVRTPEEEMMDAIGPQEAGEA